MSLALAVALELDLARFRFWVQLLKHIHSIFRSRFTEFAFHSAYLSQALGTVCLIVLFFGSFERLSAR